jgi:hypothetical protein
MGFGGVAQKFLPLRVRLRDRFQQRSRRFGIGADMRLAGSGIARELEVAGGRNAGGDFRGAFGRRRQDRRQPRRQHRFARAGEPIISR